MIAAGCAWEGRQSKRTAILVSPAYNNLHLECVIFPVVGEVGGMLALVCKCLFVCLVCKLKIGIGSIWHTYHNRPYRVGVYHMTYGICT